MKAIPKYRTARAAAKNMLVGVGSGIAADAAKVPVPQRRNSFRNFASLPFLNFLSRYADPARRAMRNVKYAPKTDPPVAVAANSYHSGRWLAARMAVRISGPANVGIGELSRMARKKSPAAPRCRSVDRNVGLARRREVCAIRLSILAIYQARAKLPAPSPSSRLKSRTLHPIFFTMVVSNSFPLGRFTNILFPAKRTGTTLPFPSSPG